MHFLILQIAFVLQETHGEDQVQTFIQDLLDARWVPIKSLFERYHDPELCKFNDIFRIESFKEKAEADVTYALERFKLVQGYNFSIQRRDVQAIRDLEMMDFFEFIVDEAVGPQLTMQFFSDCFK
jgi:hypothetical protein